MIHRLCMTDSWFPWISATTITTKSNVKVAIFFFPQKCELSSHWTFLSKPPTFFFSVIYLAVLVSVLNLETLMSQLDTGFTWGKDEQTWFHLWFPCGKSRKYFGLFFSWEQPQQSLTSLLHLKIITVCIFSSRRCHL